MKIVHTEASWGWGGQEIRVLRECELLIAAGHSVQLLADPQSLIAQRASQYGVPVVQTRLAKKRIPDLLAVATALKRINPDVVACHSSTDHWLTATVRLLFRHRYKIARFRHISTPVKPSLLNRWLYRNGAEVVITTGKFIAQQLIDNDILPADRLFSIPTGINPADYPSKNIAVAKAALDIPTDCFVIGIVATLRSWKGHEDLIKAVAQINTKNIRLLIVGEGPQQNNLRTLTKLLGLEGQVIFTGHQNNVLPFLQSLDVFVLPSYANEGVPQAILQAMAIGLSVISCPTGGIEESLQNYDNSVLVPTRDIPALTNAIRQKIKLWQSGETTERTPHVPFTETQMLVDCINAYKYTIQKELLI